MRRLPLLILLLFASCVSHPAPVVEAAPHYFSLPTFLRETDYLCDVTEHVGTCVSVREVRAFLRSRKAAP